MTVFPAGFLVGAAPAAHQIEGNNVASDLWRLEVAEDSPLGEPSGDACDSYQRWREDMELAAAAGLTAYRFSVEWARIEPADGACSPAQVLHYLAMVRYARELGLEPVLTLHHFTSPAWFSAEGGWLRVDAVARFLAYVEAIEPVLAEAGRYVVTINEPNMVAVMAAVRAGQGALETGLGGGLPTPLQPTVDALTAVHRATRDYLHAHHPHLRVGWTVANQVVQALPGGEAGANAYREAIEDQFLRVSREDDFVGVQSYTRNRVGPSGVLPVPEDAPTTLTGWEYYPASLGEAVRHTAEVVGHDVPVLVTENGIATADDDQRIAYTQGALAGLGAAVADGIDVRGYLHWSLLDNYEWGSYRPTFGLIAVDRRTFVRTPKRSLGWLGEWARAGRFPRA